MESEFEKHVAMQPKKAVQSKALQLYSPPDVIDNPVQ